MPEENIGETNHHTTNSLLSTLLKEVSDMKSELAVNSSETRNIKEGLNEIKQDVKEIKNDFVNRREHNETINALRKEFNDSNTNLKEEFINLVKGLKKDIDLPKKVIYSIISAVGLAILAALLKLILK